MYLGFGLLLCGLLPEAEVADLSAAAADLTCWTHGPTTCHWDHIKSDTELNTMVGCIKPSILPNTKTYI